MATDSADESSPHSYVPTRVDRGARMADYEGSMTNPVRIVKISPNPADDHFIDETGKTVHEHNPEYPSDDRVVMVQFEAGRKRENHGRPVGEDQLDPFSDRNYVDVTTYSYPLSRMYPVPEPGDRANASHIAGRLDIDLSRVFADRDGTNSDTGSVNAGVLVDSLSADRIQRVNSLPGWVFSEALPHNGRVFVRFVATAAGDVAEDDTYTPLGKRDADAIEEARQ